MHVSSLRFSAAQPVGFGERSLKGGANASDKDRGAMLKAVMDIKKGGMNTFTYDPSTYSVVAAYNSPASDDAAYERAGGNMSKLRKG